MWMLGHIIIWSWILDMEDVDGHLLYDYAVDMKDVDGQVFYEYTGYK